MMKTILFLTVLSGILFMSGCATKEPLYYYGSYSQNYYNYKKNMGPESELELQKAIEDAIANAQDGESHRVAPGMYANLGYLYLKQGKSAKARENFIREKKLYPESAHFMDRLIRKIDAAEGESNEK